VRQAHEIWNKRVTTGELNRWFEPRWRSSAAVGRWRRLKLRYVTQAKARHRRFWHLARERNGSPTIIRAIW